MPATTARPRPEPSPCGRVADDFGEVDVGLLLVGPSRECQRDQLVDQVGQFPGLTLDVGEQPRARAGGALVGTAGTLGTFVGASSFPAAVSFAVLLNLNVGSLPASGFTMAAALSAPHRQDVIASVVTVVSAVGAAVLASTSVVVDGPR